MDVFAFREELVSKSHQHPGGGHPSRRGIPSRVPSARTTSGAAAAATRPGGYDGQHDRTGLDAFRVGEPEGKTYPPRHLSSGLGGRRYVHLYAGDDSHTHKLSAKTE